MGRWRRSVIHFRRSLVRLKERPISDWDFFKVLRFKRRYYFTPSYRMSLWSIEIGENWSFKEVVCASKRIGGGGDFPLFGRLP